MLVRGFRRCYLTYASSVATGHRPRGERMEFETFVIIATIVIVVLIFSMSSGRRRMLHMQQRICGACGAAHPPFAQFCRRCGQRL